MDSRTQTNSANVHNFFCNKMLLNKTHISAKKEHKLVQDVKNAKRLITTWYKQNSPAVDNHLNIKRFAGVSTVYILHLPDHRFGYRCINV